MYAVMGVTGQVGAVVAETLLARGEQVRAVVRNSEKAASWRERGAEIGVADFNDAAALTDAFRGTVGVFAMLPPNFAPAEGFPEVRATIAAIKAAIVATKPGKLVCLSTIGAQQSSGIGILEALHVFEEELSAAGVPVAFIRAGWFMENALWDIPSARDTGKMYSYLQPLNKRFSLASTTDIGRVAAETLLQDWTGCRFIEVAGPKEYSPAEMADGFAKVLGRAVKAEVVPRERWASNFVEQGTPADRTGGRVAMLDGFNSGWISFGASGTEHVQGTVDFEMALRALMARG